MRIEILLILCLCYIQLLFIIKIEGKTQCGYYISTNGNISYTTCRDDCCTSIASSSDTACCSSMSLRSLIIPFFVVIGVCILGICIVYCRPLWIKCLCGHCPCGNQSRVQSSRTISTHENPIFVVNNDLPDYETISKQSDQKDLTPPPYNFVASHPNEFGIQTRVPSAPPLYSSRRNSSATINFENSTH